MDRGSIFIPKNEYPYYEEIGVKYKRFQGKSNSAKCKSEISLHLNYNQVYSNKVLEVNPSSISFLGRQLSTTKLLKKTKQGTMLLEYIYQASKVFTMGSGTVGPYIDTLYKHTISFIKNMTYLCKGKEELRFQYEGLVFNKPRYHRSLFFDYLYLNVILEEDNERTLRRLLNSKYTAFSDLDASIDYSPARSCAILLSLYKLDMLDEVKDYKRYLTLFRVDPNNLGELNGAWKNAQYLGEDGLVKLLRPCVVVNKSISDDIIKEEYKRRCGHFLDKKLRGYSLLSLYEINLDNYIGVCRLFIGKKPLGIRFIFEDGCIDVPIELIIGYSDEYLRIKQLQQVDGVLISKEEYDTKILYPSVSEYNEDILEILLAKLTKKSDFKFIMPDGSLVTNCDGVDNYFGLKPNTTVRRLRSGWTIKECSKNEKDGVKKSNKVKETHEVVSTRSNESKKKIKEDTNFYMPDGTILRNSTSVDRFYSLPKRTTAGRLLKGWTREECANNEKLTEDSYKSVEANYEDITLVLKRIRECKSPDGHTFNNMNDVDNYYRLSRGTTRKRLRAGWSVEECVANYKKGVSDLETSTKKQEERVKKLVVEELKKQSNEEKKKSEEKDKKKASKRISKSWWSISGKYEFHMPSGITIRTCVGVDRYYGLKEGTTNKRLKRGWSTVECANNKIEPLVKEEGSNKTKTVEEQENKSTTKKPKSLKPCRFSMPDGRVLANCEEVDKYYNLDIGTTRDRLEKRNWSSSQCARNRQRQTDVRYTMPDGRVFCGTTDIDRFYGLLEGTTENRLNSGWSMEECISNSHEYALNEIITSSSVTRNSFKVDGGDIVNMYVEYYTQYYLDWGIIKGVVQDNIRELYKSAKSELFKYIASDTGTKRLKELGVDVGCINGDFYTPGSCRMNKNSRTIFVDFKLRDNILALKDKLEIEETQKYKDDNSIV